MMEKILVDTDIGNDIDDTVCLAYLLQQKNCELLGITTVSGEPIVRAKLVSALLKSAGRDNIPIYPGVSEPLLTPQKQPIAHQAKYLQKYPHEEKFPKGEAIEFMRRTIKANPHKVTLLAIGPMTNIALLFALDPEIPLLLKQLVVMCGVFTFNYRGDTCLTEWNARCDPIATAMVYNAPVNKIVSVGLDVTGKVELQKEEILKTFDKGLLRIVLDFSGIQDGTRERIIFHDPLAAAIIFDKEICGFKTGTVDVTTGDSHLEGLTHFTPDTNGNNEIALTVDRDRFFGHFFSVMHS